jgi:hypothetical protein
VPQITGRNTIDINEFATANSSSKTNPLIVNTFDGFHDPLKCCAVNGLMGSPKIKGHRGPNSAAVRIATMNEIEVARAII